MNTNTEQKTVYILQKDLPDFKAGTKYTRKKFFHFSGDEVSYFPNTKELDSTSVRGIHKDYVENNPEWFLPEQPKEWEIVAYSHNQTGLTWGKGNLGNIDWDICLRQNESYSIHTVRRLSDGETFSVGENCGYVSISTRENKEQSKSGIIYKFEITTRNDIWASGKNGFFIASLDKLSKLPPPTPKEETIKVLQLAGGTDCKNGSFAYSFVTSSKIPDLKYQPIMNAIEDVLNEGKPKWEWPKERWVGFYDSVNAKVIQLYKSIVDSQSEEIARLRKEILSFIDN